MPRLSNAEIAKVLLGLAQLLSVQKENPFKIRAYRRAAKAIVNLPESIDELVRSDSDLTASQESANQLAVRSERSCSEGAFSSSLKISA